MSYDKVTPRYAQSQTRTLQTRLTTGEVVMWCTSCDKKVNVDTEVIDGETQMKARQARNLGGWWHRGFFGHRVEPRNAGTVGGDGERRGRDA